MYVKDAWKKAHYREAYAKAYDTVLDQSANKKEVVISSTISVSAASVQRMIDIKAVWTIDSSGGISLVLDVAKNPEFPELPRFEVRLFLNNRFSDISYYGYGPLESYRDKHWASSHGLIMQRSTSCMRTISAHRKMAATLIVIT